MAPQVNIVCFLVLILAVLDRTDGQTNNVCKSYLDYVTLFVNPRCWHNHDVSSNTVDMIIRNGYPVEAYNVETEDGYILSLYRIPHNNKTRCSCRQPVFIQHGIQTTSEVWTDIGDRSMAFYLSDRCYDVWLGNFRGTPHSQTHVKYSTQHRQFWNYSWHEMGLYDVSANLDFIKEKTGGKCKTIYIGHSMGTTMSLVYSIMKPHEAKKTLEGLVLLAPVAYNAHFRTPIKLLAPFWRQIRDVVHLLHLYGIIKNHFYQEVISNAVCSQFPSMLLCLFGLFSYHGFDFQKLLPQDVPLVFDYTPSGGAFKSFSHYLQQLNSGGNFQMYDYESRNVDVYGQAKPPRYEVSNIKLPIHLMYGSRDFLGVKEDVQRLYSEVSSKEKSITEFDYNHLDFMYSKDLKTNLYPILLEKLESLRCEKCKSETSLITEFSE